MILISNQNEAHIDPNKLFLCTLWSMDLERLYTDALDYTFDARLHIMTGWALQDAFNYNTVYSR